MGFSVVIFIVFVIVMAIIVLWSRRALNKQKGIFEQFMASGQAEESKGNDSQAVAFYKHALAVILGIAEGSVELTAKGVGMILQQSGRTAVDRLNAIYARHAVQPSWEEFNALVAEFQKMSTNPDLVNRYGVPKGEAKQMFALLQEKLKRCIEALPGLEAATAQPHAPAGAAIPPSEVSLPSAGASTPPPLPPVGEAMPPAFPSYPASATPATAYTIPNSEEVAARNRTARKRRTIIILSVVGGVVLLCGLVVILMIVGLVGSGGVLRNIQTVISTATP